MTFSSAFLDAMPSLAGIGDNHDLTLRVLDIVNAGFSSVLQDSLNGCGETDSVLVVLAVHQKVLEADARESTLPIPLPIKGGGFDAKLALGVTDSNSIITCISCGGQDVAYALRQRRSADEGMSCVCTCRSCNTNFIL